MPPEAFTPTDVVRILNPFDKKSHQVLPELSAEEVFNSIPPLVTLYGLQELSTCHQLVPALSVLFINKYLGLILVKIIGPSAEPFPVKLPKAEYPAMGVQQ